MPPKRKRTLYLVEDDPLWGALFEEHLPKETWGYVWCKTTEEATDRLSEAANGDRLVLDMAFAVDRFKGLEVISWIRSNKIYLLGAMVIFTCFDDMETREKLKPLQLQRLTIMVKTKGVDAVLEHLGIVDKP